MALSTGVSIIALGISIECYYAVLSFLIFMLNVIMMNCVVLDVIVLNVVMLNVAMLNFTVLNVAMLNGIMLNFAMLNGIVLNVAMLNVIILNDGMFNVITLSIIVPSQIICAFLLDFSESCLHKQLPSTRKRYSLRKRFYFILLISIFLL
jgi:hypothetical protein